jgi:hypothetical protein
MALMGKLPGKLSHEGWEDDAWPDGINGMLSECEVFREMMVSTG